MIRHAHLDDGSFAVINPATREAAYAFAGSDNARLARKHPERIAQSMLDSSRLPDDMRRNFAHLVESHYLAVAAHFA